MPAEENKKIVQAFYDAGNRGDMDTCFDLIADDIVWTNIGTTSLSGRFEGKQELQEVLETTHILSRLEKVLRLINKELEVARAQMKIRKHVEEEIQSHQKEMFLHEQLKAIQQELGQQGDRPAGGAFLLALFPGNAGNIDVCPAVVFRKP